MDKAFINFTWKNTPSIESPINASNLNSINNGLDTVDDRVIALDTNKADKSDLLQSLKTVSYAPSTGVWTFTYNNGTTYSVDQNVDKIPVSFTLSSNGILTMTTADGTQFTCDIATLIKTYTFNDSNTIDFTVTTSETGNKTIVADIVDGSVTANKLQPNYLADVTTQAQNASGSANSALSSATNAAADALLSQSYAIGNSGVRPGEDTDNSKYYKEQSALEGEAWSRGTRGGTPVPSTDETYENNSKYYAEQSSLEGEAWSAGTRGGVPVPSTEVQYENNSKYYSQLANGYQQQAKQYRDEAQQIVGIGIATPTTPGLIKPDDNTIFTAVDGTTTAGISDTDWQAMQVILGTYEPEP